jgi:hypothetical protein
MTIATHLVSPADLLNQARAVVCLDRWRCLPAQASNPRWSVHAARFVPAWPARARPTPQKKPHAAAWPTLQSPIA